MKFSSLYIWLEGVFYYIPEVIQLLPDPYLVPFSLCFHFVMENIDVRVILSILLSHYMTHE